jgi:hypothetical protein
MVTGHAEEVRVKLDAPTKEKVAIGICAASVLAAAAAMRAKLRIPRDGEQRFHGIVNTDSTAT